MIVRLFPHGSAEYRASLTLRCRFLREPLGLMLTPADLAGEEDQLHFGLFLSEEDQAVCPPPEGLVASLIAKPLESPPQGVTRVMGAADAESGVSAPSEAVFEGYFTGPVRLRQVVVHDDFRSCGAGRRLLAGAEKHLSELGATEFRLFARTPVAGFYQRCGYELTGLVAELIGLPHSELVKTYRGLE
ncbi:GNAT family N-acetyltransferase [Botrimarina hoheduenensis]|uniref:Acetyltransferase (GNAT) family protein n=1 Tax=Botrimarina hoheduenensis TaxID=2528000 RepID=A0A5C5VZK8_9BACT|nr:GNAT family N-acetyltransferase [Botrimarina hoheduenensis]TWT43413.1 Acetyltransferase (GNAT) family protein [Botrimarina hoheduenensis]